MNIHKNRNSISSVKVIIMSSSLSTSSLFLLSCILLVQMAMGVNPLFHFCSSSNNFTSNGPYETNLNKLMGDLYFKTPPTGFGLGSIGQYQTRASGLALCRGDVSSTDCKSCVVEASGEIRRRCPSNKAAIIWYDNCLLKYSDMDFFGKIDEQNKFHMYNLRNVSNPEYFNTEVKKLLSELSEKAYVSPKLYATGDSKLGESKKLYGLVQCTRDLSSVDCKKCVDGAISELPICCDGKEGGRVVVGSCNVGYEIYPFVNA
ncbi:hypothetical protein RJ640_011266 [Escallonia rubra]|uniref:Gnk2-homologous domain-containing protein n=1 Tax=Escallonia rubra TaxID=112253 RepID=A0AA88UNT9_9ASTE|nr:hypothetical protein RJ640_011266 [Escallonia rubra]